MKIEKLRKNHKKKIIIGGLILVGILSTLILTSTRAKYKTTQSINIVNGTINYKPYDLKVLAMYKQKEGSTCTEDSCYEEITGRMPSSGYTINESKSYCTVDGINRDTEAVLKTINGIHAISNLAKNEKCKLYFDKIKVTNIQELIAYSHINIGSPDFSKTATTDEGIFIASDGMYGGNSYYWRGALEELENYYHLKHNNHGHNGFNYEVIATPGHTSDCLTFYFKEENVMFTGDFLFYHTCGRCDLKTSSILDMKNSLEKIKKYDDAIIIYPGHGKPSILGEEKPLFASYF